jgi:uncharacterized protein (DUF1330 family)
MAIDPKGTDLKRLLNEDPGGAVVMLNLLRFASGKREQYVRYLREFRPFAEKYGAQVIFVGDGSTAVVAEPGQAWDAVLLVRYPTRLAFSRMVADPEYQKITQLRTTALTEAVLQATTPWTDC